jgi:LacI family transcriptional regulator
MCISNESMDKEAHTLEMLSNGTMGFICQCLKKHKIRWIQSFSAIIDGTPIVMFDRTADGIECDKVIVDDFDSALNSTQRLIDLGCKIACCLQ